MTETILSTYEGHSIFTLFMDKFDVYEQINKQFNDNTFMEEINDKEKEES